MSEKRERYLTLEDARALLTVSVSSDDPKLPLARTLHELGLLRDADFRVLESEIQRAQGHANAILEHVRSGGEIDPEQATQLLVVALGGGLIDTPELNRAAAIAAPGLGEVVNKLSGAVRASQNRERSVNAYESIVGAIKELDGTAAEHLIQIGIELMTKIASSSGEIATRKALTLRTMRAAQATDLSTIASVVEAALVRGVVRTYDIVHDSKLIGTCINETSALLELGSRAETEADLSAACSVVAKISDQNALGKYMRTLSKQFGDGKKPTLTDVRQYSVGLTGLVKLHVAAPSTPAASHDEALLRRWATLHPSQAAALTAAANEIGAARAPYTERFKTERVGTERLALAKRHVKETIVPAKQIILLVGGTYSADIIDAFNEFHPADPVWGDWILKERLQPLKHGEVDERIGSVKCAGVVIIAKPAGHSIVDQAKVAVGRYGKTHVIIHNSSKRALRDGLTDLLVRLATKSEARSGQS